MARKRHNKSKEELYSEIRNAKVDKALIIGGRVQMAVSIAVLWDVFDFSEEEIDTFVDKSHEFLESYYAGNEDVVKIIGDIKDVIGIDLFGELKGGNENGES